jgi:hypothetical protein
VRPVFWRGNTQEMVGRRGLGDNIKMHLKEIGWKAVNCSSLAEGGKILLTFVTRKWTLGLNNSRRFS